MGERCRFGVVIVRSDLGEPVSGAAEQCGAPGGRSIQLCGTVDFETRASAPPPQGGVGELLGGQAAIGSGGAQASK